MSMPKENRRIAVVKSTQLPAKRLLRDSHSARKISGTNIIRSRTAPMIDVSYPRNMPERCTAKYPVISSPRMIRIINKCDDARFFILLAADFANERGLFHVYLSAFFRENPRLNLIENIQGPSLSTRVQRL